MTIPTLPGTLFLGLSFLAPTLASQEPPPSGSFGLDVFAITDQNGDSSLRFVHRLGAVETAADLPAPPSRWLHGRRHMAAEEARISRDFSKGPVLFLPLGDQPANGALAVVDIRGGFPPRNTFVPLTAPPSYEPLVDSDRELVFCASDDGMGHTVVEAVGYGLSLGPTPMVVGAVTLSGAPAGGATHVLSRNGQLLVPTTDGVHLVGIEEDGGMNAGPLVDTGARSPVTNVAEFELRAAPHFAFMASDFGANDRPSDAVVVSFDLTGNSVTMPVGNVPNTVPAKAYVPAAGFQSPGVVAGGGLAYVAFLLREREPGTFFTKPAGVAVAGFNSLEDDPTLTVVRTLAESGEPFAELAVHGTRMAFMTSESPDWWPSPPGGAERFNILYTPLDPVGAGTVGGVIGSTGPLGGRIAVENADRPLWSHDGKALFVTTVNFPGAPNPGLSGSELVRVPSDRAVNPDLDLSLTTLPLGDQVDERSYGLPTRFAPADLPLASFGDFTLFGQVTQTAAHGVLVPGSIPGYLATSSNLPSRLQRDSNIPGFPSIPPRTFEDHDGIRPAPDTFGARRASFNLFDHAGHAMLIYMVQAAGDSLLYHATGYNLLGFSAPIQVITIPLPQGSILASEILSL